MRVVSLVPAATEVCHALGVQPVGVSHACDWPPQVATVPSVTETRLSPGADAAAIDRAVEELGPETITLDRHALRAVDPDIVVAQGLCEVCGVGRSAALEALESMDLDARLVSHHPHTLSEVFGAVLEVGAVLDRRDRAERLVSALRERRRAVERAVADRDRRSVAVLEWLDPPMAAGHWTPDLVAAAGGRDVLASPGSASRPVEWADVRRVDPEVLVVAPCGFDLERAVDGVATLAEQDGWADLRAVQSGTVAAVDGHHYLTRPGPRLVDAMEGLAALLHPGTVEGRGDRRVARIESGDWA